MARREREISCSFFIGGAQHIRLCVGIPTRSGGGKWLRLPNLRGERRTREDPPPVLKEELEGKTVPSLSMTGSGAMPVIFHPSKHKMM